MPSNKEEKLRKHGLESKPAKKLSGMREKKPIFCSEDGLELIQEVEKEEIKYDIYDGSKVVTTRYVYICPVSGYDHPIYRYIEVVGEKDKPGGNPNE